MELEHLSWTALVAVVLDYLVRAGLSVRVIMRRRPVGVSLAWLSILLIFPFVGAFIYLLVGELRLGRRRALAAAKLHGPYHHWLTELRSRAEVDWSDRGVSFEPMARLAEVAGGIPALGDNAWELLDAYQVVFDRMIADIDAARRTCHLEFYIWSEGGTADDVAEALLRAAARGVACRVLVDAVGSHAFLRGGLAARLRAGGVAVRAAMQVSLVRMIFVRFDLRLHRKIAVIDGAVAYTGSQNLVDPRYFKQAAHIGPWIDAMTRVRGPVVEALAITFLEDWELETGERVERIDGKVDDLPLPHAGSTVIQAVPSGPVATAESIQAVLLQAIYSARREVVLTTPYFVPDELLLTALGSAALRGVAVTLVVPARVDSRLASLASEPHKGQLMESGVTIVEFEPGLLHTKSVTVDGVLSLFGSLNLDPRSFVLNFEITLIAYDREFTEALRRLQGSYLRKSATLDLATWNARPPLRRFAENAARLLSPLL